MFLRILASQIPDHWELIKYCLVEVYGIDAHDRQKEAIAMLHALLSSKAQCFVRLNDNREITLLLVTRLTTNRLTGEIAFWIDCAYSFQKSDIDTWRRDWEILRRFALDAGCSWGYFQSSNKRVWELAKIAGCHEKHRTYAIKIAA